MIDYQKLISNIPNLADGDLVLTNSYYFAGSLNAKQNLIYINDFKNFYSDPIRSDWVISVGEIEYSSMFSAEKGICCLENDLSYLTAKNLKCLYQEQGLYIYKIIALDESEEYKYFIILKKRCCTRCRFRNNSCCPTTELSEPETHQHSENQRFDFFDFIL
jgi:hypothetical protein